jgi:hypothetical protein
MLFDDIRKARIAQEQEQQRITKQKADKERSVEQKYLAELTSCSNQFWKMYDVFGKKTHNIVIQFVEALSGKQTRILSTSLKAEFVNVGTQTLGIPSGISTSAIINEATWIMDLLADLKSNSRSNVDNKLLSIHNGFRWNPLYGRKYNYLPTELSFSITRGYRTVGTLSEEQSIPVTIVVRINKNGLQIGSNEYMQSYSQDQIVQEMLEANKVAMSLADPKDPFSN